MVSAINGTIPNRARRRLNSRFIDNACHESFY
jgi:hypothetical protein